MAQDHLLPNRSPESFFTLKGFLCILTLFLAHGYLQARPNGISKKDRFLIHSEILGEERDILIQYPRSYFVTPKDRFPTLYVLDGENHFDLVAGIVDYLSRDIVNAMPETIVIGIISKDRNRDLTPTPITPKNPDPLYPNRRYPNSGGNERFIQFLRDELVPHIDTQHRTQPFRILSGHSLGGVAAINSLLTQPDLFQAYIAASPSLWWDDQYLLKQFDVRFEKGSHLKKLLYLSVGNEEQNASRTPNFHSVIQSFSELCAEKSLIGFEHTFVRYSEEGHMTIPVKAYYDGLRFIYQPWGSFDTSDKNARAAIITKHYADLSDRYGYNILPPAPFFNAWGHYLLSRPETLENAIELFEMNANNHPSSAAFASLGDAYAQSGETDKARSSYQRALDLTPNDESIRSKVAAMEDPTPRQ